MKYGMVRRMICAGIAAVLMASLPVQVLADTWCVDQGSIDISVDSSSTQTVSQNQSGGTVSKQDSSPVITNSNPSVATSNTITVNTAEGQTANFTVQNVNIDTGSADKPAIDVGASSAVITVEGINTIKQTGLTDGESAAVHVSSGDLTIQGDASDGADKLTITSVNTAIGSNDQEDMSGNIGIDGDVSIKIDNRWPGNPYGNKGSGIGSGENADVAGSITINSGDIYVWQNNNSVAIGANKNLTGEININGGTVFAVGGGNSTGIGANGNVAGNINITGGGIEAGGGWYSAGIGTGNNGKLSGSINISGGNIHASAGEWSAAIGTGENGTLNGDINLTGGEIRAFGGFHAAGIGTGMYGYMDGNIRIEEGSIEASGSGAGIGTGEYGMMNGVIDISGGTTTAESRGYGAGIGAAQGGYLTGDVIIRGDAEVTAKSTDDNASVGIGLTRDYTAGGNMTGTIQILDYANVTALNGNYGSYNSYGTIGRGYPVTHDNPKGQFIVSTGATINGTVNPTCADDVDGIITFHKDTDGNPTNLTFVSPSKPEIDSGENQEDSAATSGEDSVQIDACKWNNTLFQVLDEKGDSIPHTAIQESGILTITTETDYAQLLVYGGNLKVLMKRGVTDIVFQTNGGVSQYNLAQVYQAMPSGTSRLTHDGGAISFTLNNVEHSALI